MGCFQSSRLSRSLPQRLSIPFTTLRPLNMTAEEKQHLTAIWHVLRAQGTDTDVGYLMYERFFEQFPNAKEIFADYGKFENLKVADFRTDTRFRMQLREVVLSLGACVDLLEDEELLLKYLQELREIHEQVKGLKTEYFEVIARCLDHAVNNTLAKSLTKSEKDSVKKFSYFVANNVSPLLKPSGEKAKNNEITAL